MNSSLHVLAPPALTAAVRQAAARDLTNASEYVRRAVVKQLRADGIDPNIAPEHHGAAAA